MFFKVTQSSNISNPQMSKYIDENKKNNETIILNYNSKKESFTDLIVNRNYILISDRLKSIFKKYKDDVIDRCVVWIDANEQVQEVYWILNLPIIQCASENSEVLADSTIKKLILDKEKIENEAMFLVCMVKNSNSIYAQKILILNLSVCESLLRRNVTGLDYELMHMK